MSNPNISVVIPVYNASNYIEVQLRSILKQTLLPDEIIICDDCSTDDTVNVVERIISENLVNRKIINLIKNVERLGMNLNFEKAISLCHGEYIFLCDADDYWFKNKVNYMHKLLSKSNSLIAINNCRFTDAQLNPLKIKKIEQIEKIFNSSDNFIPGCCVVFKKKLKEIYLPLPYHSISYDTWLNFVGNKISKRILVRNVFQLYRRHFTNNTSAIFNITKKLNFFNIILIRIKILTKSIFLRDRIILSEISKHEEIIKRIKDSNNFDDQTNIQIEADLKKLYLRKNLLSKNFFTRIYFSLFDKKYTNIWGSKISKFLDILRIS